MTIIHNLLDVILHLDKYLNTLVTNYGTLTYLILFLIIFAETAFVITPFLPGDSIIFAASALSALGSLNIYLIISLFLIAAIVGDAINYSIGRYLGEKLLTRKDSKIIKKEYIDKTNAYYDKYGGKTIIIARFIPIVRTFAPFVAGIGKMQYSNFFKFNVIGGILWVFIVSFSGYFFGNIKFVANNFSLVVIGIIAISLLPPIISLLKSNYSSKKAI